MGDDGRGGRPARGKLLGDPPTEPIAVIKSQPGGDWWDPAWDADWWGPRWQTVTAGLSELIVKPRTPEAGPPSAAAPLAAGAASAAAPLSASAQSVAAPPSAWPAPETVGPAPAGPPGATPAVRTPAAEPSWARVLVTTISLWTSRHRSGISIRRRHDPGPHADPEPRHDPSPPPGAPVRASRGRLLAAPMLGAGVLAVAAGAAGLAVAGGPSVRTAPLPAPPTPVATPSGPTVNPVGLQTTALPAAPVSLTIPAIGVKTSLVHLGLQANGTLEVPGTPTVAGWYTGSPRPGAAGAAVIAGHVDSRYGPGIFFWLRSMRAGERIYVKRADGTLAVFTVTGVRTYPKDQFPTAAVYGPAPDAELRLITCGGIFDQSVGSYLSNVVVFARLTA
jgi:sortase (surface protein transpeptidase)